MRLIIITGILIVSTLLGIESCRRAQDVAPRSALEQTLDSILAPVFGGSKAPGAEILIMQGDSVLYNRGYGYADLNKKTLISDTTVFNISSASKSFSAAALLMLAEQGFLSLDDSLSKFFPNMPSKVFNGITIRHILTHSSGLPDLRPRNAEEWNHYLRTHESIYSYGSDYRLYGTEKEHIKIFENLDTLEYAPGSDYAHDDPAYILVAPLIERVTGMKYDQWMSRNLFDPAEMTVVHYINPGTDKPHTAHGYVPDGNGGWQERDYREAEFFLTKADRGAFTSAKEFMQWNKALYGEKLISGLSLDNMMYPALSAKGDGDFFGLGTGVHLEPGKAARAYHTNSNGGFAILEAAYPARDLYFVVFANRNDWDRRKVLKDIDDALYRYGLTTLQ